MSKKGTSRKKPKKTRYQQEIYRDWCKQCGICASFCPKGVVKLNEAGEPTVVEPDKCSGCRVCELRCPDFAISIKEKEKE